MEANHSVTAETAIRGNGNQPITGVLPIAWMPNSNRESGRLTFWKVSAKRVGDVTPAGIDISTAPRHPLRDERKPGPIRSRRGDSRRCRAHETPACPGKERWLHERAAVVGG